MYKRDFLVRWTYDPAATAAPDGHRRALDARERARSGRSGWNRSRPCVRRTVLTCGAAREPRGRPGRASYVHGPRSAPARTSDGAAVGGAAPGSGGPRERRGLCGLRAGRDDQRAADRHPRSALRRRSTPASGSRMTPAPRRRTPRRQSPLRSGQGHASRLSRELRVPEPAESHVKSTPVRGALVRPAPAGQSVAPNVCRGRQTWDFCARGWCCADGGGRGHVERSDQRTPPGAGC